jgi:hypothetical protein
MVLQSWVQVESTRKYNYLSFACITYHLRAFARITYHFLLLPIICDHFWGFSAAQACLHPTNALILYFSFLQKTHII